MTRNLDWFEIEDQSIFLGSNLTGCKFPDLRSCRRANSKLLKVILDQKHLLSPHFSTVRRAAMKSSHIGEQTKIKRTPAGADPNRQLHFVQLLYRFSALNKQSSLSSIEAVFTTVEIDP